MYGRTIESLLYSKARAIEQERNYQVREDAAKLFARGQYLAQYPHRDYDASVAAFTTAIETITKQIKPEKWTNAEFKQIMQCYERLVTFAVCNRSSLAAAEMKTKTSADEKKLAKSHAHVKAQAEASAWLQAAMSFYQNNKDDSRYICMPYIYSLLSACSNYAHGIYESAVLTDQPMSKTDYATIKSVARDMVKILQEAEESKLHLEFSAEQLRKLSQWHDNIISLYRITSENIETLKRAQSSISHLNAIVENEKKTQDFFQIADVYDKLAMTFHRSKELSALFKQACDYFSGRPVSFDAFKKSVTRNCLALNQEIDIINALDQLLSVIDTNLKHTEMPKSELNTQLRQPANYAIFEQLLHHKEKKKVSFAPAKQQHSLFSEGSQSARAYSVHANSASDRTPTIRPETARAHTQTDYMQQDFYQPKAPPMGRKKTV